MIPNNFPIFYSFYNIEDKKKMASKKIALILGKLYFKFANTAITGIYYTQILTTIIDFLNLYLLRILYRLSIYYL